MKYIIACVAMLAVASAALVDEIPGDEPFDMLGNDSNTTTSTPITTTKSLITTDANITTTPESDITTTPESDITTHAHNITILPPTTKKPTGTPTFTFKEGDNTTCILLQADIKVKFSYAMDNKTVAVDSMVPGGAKTSGKCDNNSNSMDITWSAMSGNVTTQLSMALEFGRNKTDYVLSNAMFTYNNNINDTTTAKLNKFATALGKSYNCTTGASFMVGKANITMTKLRIVAFLGSKDPSPKFTETGSDCAPVKPPGSKTNAIVPIAVGAALAAMVVIVLIGYCIGRRRQAAGYQSMNSAS